LKDKIKSQKTLFLILGLVIILLLAVIGVVKYLDYRKNSSFNFDIVTPQGEFKDLETSTPEPIESVTNE
jgi:hypothetical protein